MTSHPGSVRPLTSRLRVVNCVDQTKKFDVRRQYERVGPPLVRIYQVLEPRKYNDLSPKRRCYKNKELPGMPPTDFITDGQGANHVSHPAEPANDDGSLAMPSALENQPYTPHNKRCPPVTYPQSET